MSVLPVDVALGKELPLFYRQVLRSPERLWVLVQLFPSSRARILRTLEVSWKLTVLCREGWTLESEVLGRLMDYLVCLIV